MALNVTRAHTFRARTFSATETMPSSACSRPFPSLPQACRPASGPMHKSPRRQRRDKSRGSFGQHGPDFRPELVEPAGEVRRLVGGCDQRVISSARRGRSRKIGRIDPQRCLPDRRIPLDSK